MKMRRFFEFDHRQVLLLFAPSTQLLSIVVM